MVDNSTSIVLGIDAGTTSVKTVAFTLDGAVVAVARANVAIERGADLRAEVDMEALWSATAGTIREVTSALSATAHRVVAIGITGQGDGAWFVDEDGKPVRSAALWLDGRAAAHLERWNTDGRAEAVHFVTGSPLFPGALPLLLESILEEDPQFLEKSASQLNCKDWLRFKLTGKMATDPSEASRGYLDVARGEYSEELIAALGHTAVYDRLPEILNPVSPAGSIDADVAHTLGLPHDVVVAVGLVDTAAAGVGLGAIDDGAGYIIIGTTGFVGVNLESSSAIRTPASIVLSTGRSTQVLESLAPMAGTPNLEWARSTLGLAEAEWPAIEEQAKSSPRGSNGVLYLPYSSPSGERAPFTDGAASAAWLGMKTQTTPADLVRSVYEGLAYAITECLDVLMLTGPVAICGGGSDSDLFCSVLAEISGRPIHRQNAPEVGARGAAILAGVAAELFASLQDAVDAIVPSSTVFEPSPEGQELYALGYATFLATRDALRPQWPGLRQMRDGMAPTLNRPQ